RIATLGGEVRDPATTIPRAISLALGLVLVVYATVAVTALLTVGPAGLAAASAPLAAVAGSGSLGFLAPAVRVGGAVASAGVLLSLMAGVGRTTMAMARDRELPRALAAVHPRFRVPHRAELLLGAVVAVIVLVADVRGAIGFSSFAVLVYYAVANAAAFTLDGPDRPWWLRPLTVTGLLGCLALAFSLPAATVVTGIGVLAAGVVGRALLRLVPGSAGDRQADG
ncbi:APC family permease, partial [Pseudonocardia sp. KRD291]|uniref:APC family permease n=1 Tax=Pseudonocardia sp. KRD291 TaxID=2792007 RepID=UPI001C4A363E